MEKKVKRRLTIPERVRIIERLEAGEKEINLAKEYGVSQPAISQIKYNKKNIITYNQCINDHGYSKDRKRMNGLENTMLDQGLFRWFTQMRSLGTPISGPVIQQKAVSLNTLMNGKKNFEASSEWLTCWKNRHKVTYLSSSGQRMYDEEIGSKKFKKEFNQFIQTENYTPDQIYNADETGLHWKSLPSTTLEASDEMYAPEREIVQDRVTVMVCSNASGTHKIPLLVIGKIKNPRCFKYVDKSSLRVHYTAQRSGWMDRPLFKDWYSNIFLPEIVSKHGPNARCLLLLDNAPAHPAARDLNKISNNCIIKYLPPNVTSLIQPMNQGVIEKIKKIYKKRLLESMIIANDDVGIDQLFNKWTMLHCCNTLAFAWDNLTEINLSTAWSNSFKVNEPKQETNDLSSLQSIRTLVDNILPNNNFSNDTITTWLNDDQDPGWEILDDHEIVTYTNDYCDEEFLDDEKPEEDMDLAEEEENITARNALEGLNKFQSFHQRWDCTPDEIKTLEKIRNNLHHYIICNEMSIDYE